MFWENMNTLDILLVSMILYDTIYVSALRITNSSIHYDKLYNNVLL